jgi:hypothetical protein
MPRVNFTEVVRISAVALKLAMMPLRSAATALCMTQALTPTRASTFTELPGLEVPYADLASRSVINATLFQVRHGKQAQSLERIKRSKSITEKHGGKVRALQAVTSDPFGLTAVTVYYTNFEAWGKASVALAADPEWQAFGAEIMGEHASADFLRSSVMRVI